MPTPKDGHEKGRRFLGGHKKRARRVQAPPGSERTGP
jgi:hypothetical protein